jgi:hypothetical protein
VGQHIFSSIIRVDGSATDSGKIYLVMGTNDMNNSSTVNDWLPECRAIREDTRDPVPITPAVDDSDNSRIVIQGLGVIGGITYKIHLGF